MTDAADAEPEAADPLDVRTEAEIVRSALRCRVVERHADDGETPLRCHAVDIDETIADLVALTWCMTSDTATLRTRAEV